jgi:antirestriction protein ArdC
MSKERFDIHQTITNKIVAAIEAGAGDFVMPWHRKKGGLMPKNVLSGNHYKGINILALWVEAQGNGFSSDVWGTYRQWAAKGAQVKKGAKASHVAFYKEITIENDQEDEERTRLFARATPVFNADQVDGWVDPEPAIVGQSAPVDTLPEAESFVAATGARILHGGSRAFYSPSTDAIQIPERTAFTGSPTSSPTETYYSTLCHELTHWTGVKTRCDRDLSSRFGSQAYAMEELVAELGAAFLSAELGIASEPRADHAQYLANWLQVLKNDKRAVFTAASAASKAVAFLHGASPT